MRSSHPAGVRTRSGYGVRVRVPATSANLGPGLDSLGLALGLHNEVTVRVVAPAPGGSEPGAEVVIEGEGAARFATGEGNLVVRSVRAAMSELDVRAPRLAVHCLNRIPSARGLGSSAASIVAGVVAGAALAAGHGEGRQVDLGWALDLCARLEGHPDNVAACLLGGLTVAWYDADGTARAVRAAPAAELTAVALVPAGRVATSEARKLLPAVVDLGDATHAGGRSALVVLAVTAHPELLLAATEDRLHQAYRAPVMPASVALLDRLRAAGLAATISGAGPSVLVLGSGSADALLDAVTRCDVAGFTAMPLASEPDGVDYRSVPNDPLVGVPG